MVLVSVPALYDGKEVRLLEEAPLSQPYRVVVTFVEPISVVDTSSSDLTSFWSSFNAWQDDISFEETIRTIREGRHSKVEPPAL